MTADDGSGRRTPSKTAPTRICRYAEMKDLTRNNIVLLVCLVCLLILSPLYRERSSLIGDIFLTAIYYFGIFSLDFSSKSLKILLPLGTLTAATTWIGYIFTVDFIFFIDNTTTFLFLVAIVVLMIRHIARSSNVTPAIILSAINGYLLLGVLGGVLLSVADRLHHSLFPLQGAGIRFPGDAAPQISDYIYFGFVTLSTLGYGDVTPTSHLSRSTAVLIAITGQMYMTILIALLVGKFLARSRGRSKGS
jgi:voltage-gated potassium channel